ncbi:uncharacterized protein STEHIDRAFT_126486 [Stereum hirsutum FP-91666 SS1]|uniref:Uncharacterized protein n=1 Tax=Stereum hirsutum (strain FP-91666) TaxID=721885 RepID=R7RYT7_STEHR|nr:uncharacterized protein STEHIDRAFT_126486 [Stereum hirsutum FP-91666 SS1]EIM79492.1 hypothetical protein STEHIDRAFT_126486 [Stereum hirsutum FP-91666 SS1]
MVKPQHVKFEHISRSRASEEGEREFASQWSEGTRLRKTHPTSNPSCPSHGHPHTLHRRTSLAPRAFFTRFYEEATGKRQSVEEKRSGRLCISSSGLRNDIYLQTCPWPT